ncbi:MAG: nucleotide exchange factor GrpE, partial [Nanoarchaeota archaeon]|nr:nucleotide exchange factor GrpE [Nanoarchaeota archaeon]
MTKHKEEAREEPVPAEKHEHKKEAKEALDERQEQKEIEPSAKIAELTDMLQRLQAEYINYKNRTEQEKKACQEFGGAALALKLLPIMDTFEIALKNSEDHEKFRKGMEMLYAMLVDT